jgi:hypothetical protein
MKIEDAKKLYELGGKSREIALEYYNKAELINYLDLLPKSYIDLKTISGYELDNGFIRPHDLKIINQYAEIILPSKENLLSLVALSQSMCIKKRWLDILSDYGIDTDINFNYAYGILYSPKENKILVDQANFCSQWTHFPNYKLANEFLNFPDIYKLLEKVKYFI